MGASANVNVAATDSFTQITRYSLTDVSSNELWNLKNISDPVVSSPASDTSSQSISGP